jgi:hypothetical protein
MSNEFIIHSDHTILISFLTGKKNSANVQIGKRGFLESDLC